MEIKELEQLMDICLSDANEAESKEKYIEGLITYLQENGSTEEILSIVIHGIDIDFGSNYFDYLVSLSENELKTTYKNIEKSKSFKEGNRGKVLKFLFGLLYLSFIREGKLEVITGSVITRLNSIINSPKSPIVLSIYQPIVMDYMFNNIADCSQLPKLENIKVKPELKKQFLQSLLEAIQGEKEKGKYLHIEQWLKAGIKAATEELKMQERQELLPQSRIEDLEALVKHYKMVETKLSEAVSGIETQKETLNTLNEKVSRLETEKHELELEKQMLLKQIEDGQAKLKQVQEELNQRKTLNDAQIQYREDAQVSLRSEIARALKAEFGDVDESSNVPMSVPLGEIYREKVTNILKILEQKGVRVKD